MHFSAVVSGSQNTPRRICMLSSDRLSPADARRLWFLKVKHTTVDTASSPRFISLAQVLASGIGCPSALHSSATGRLTPEAVQMAQSL